MRLEAVLVDWPVDSDMPRYSPNVEMGVNRPAMTEIAMCFSTRNWKYGGEESKMLAVCCIRGVHKGAICLYA